MTQKNSKAGRDWWDKAHIISVFLSSVVIAVVGIFITYSIQQSQIASSTAQAEAQLSLAKLKAEADKKLQEGQLTANLIEHLASEDANRREIAILALRETIPINIYDNVLVILARNDPDHKVRQTAIKQLGESSNPTILPALQNIRDDKARSETERSLAEKSSLKVNFSTILPRNTFVYTSAQAGQMAMDNSGFTDIVIRGLAGDADFNNDGTIDVSELSAWLIARASTETQTPFSVFKGDNSTPLLSTDHYKKVYAIIIGINEYQSPRLTRLTFAAKDAERFGSYLNKATDKMNSNIIILKNSSASYSHIQETFNSFAKTIKPEDLLILYFSGHGTVDAKGNSQWLVYDSQIDDGSRAQHAIELRQIIGFLEQVNAKSSVLIVDTAMAAAGWKRR